MKSRAALANVDTKEQSAKVDDILTNLNRAILKLKAVKIAAVVKEMGVNDTPTPIA